MTSTTIKMNSFFLSIFAFVLTIANMDEPEKKSKSQTKIIITNKLRNRLIINLLRGC